MPSPVDGGPHSRGLHMEGADTEPGMLRLFLSCKCFVQCFGLQLRLIRAGRRELKDPNIWNPFLWGSEGRFISCPCSEIHKEIINCPLGNSSLPGTLSLWKYQIRAKLVQEKAQNPNDLPLTFIESLQYSGVALPILAPLRSHLRGQGTRSLARWLLPRKVWFPHLVSSQAAYCSELVFLIFDTVSPASGSHQILVCL